MQNELQAEIEAFHKKIRARALLIALEWAGSASALAELAGFDRYTGTKWTQRGAVSPLGAVRLARLKGFPLPATVVASGVDLSMFAPRRCPKCDAVINPPSYRDGCSPLLKRGWKRAAKVRRAQLAKRHPEPESQAAEN
jgi:hypothetical protein